MEFRSPSSGYRPAPFWSWNDALDNEELRWQIREMKRAGYGGFFMHSRVGLETEYLSEAWFGHIEACVDEARQADMEAWLYDEDKWPSGSVGGWLTRKFPETQGTACVAETISAGQVDARLADADTLGVFVIEKGDGGRVLSARPVVGDNRPTDGDEALAFKTVPFDKNNWFNGQAYMDVLNPEAVERFLDMTLAGYTERFRGDYGKTIPGIFTDEPNYMPWMPNSKRMSWTPKLPERFRERFGYDLIERLPALVCRAPGFEKVRHDYHRLLTELFIEAFSRPYGQMCEKLGFELTGHWLAEDTLAEQCRAIGSAMAHYEFEQVPGVDHLCRNIIDALTLKQVASVAHQFGRERVLCEIFGVSGQDFTFEDAKWIGDFHLALGVNYFCPHLTLYSFTGDRKRDYPPTFSYHQPYWDRMSLINDYFARGGYITRLGRYQTRILMLHPIASAWSFWSIFEENPEVQRYHKELTTLQDTLLGLHYDFDYGDEIILSRHGRVEGQTLRVASDGGYDTVIVPPSLTWSETTVGLLETFVDAGGTVVFAGETPRAIDGQIDEKRWARLFDRTGVTRCENQAAAVKAAMDAVCVRDVSISDATGKEIKAILYHHRRDGDKDVYFFCNTSRKDTFDARIVLNATGVPVVCDLGTGETELMACEVKEGRLRLRHRFGPVGSLAILVDPEASANDKAADARECACDRIEGDWRFSRTHPNTLVLDVCRFSLNGGPMSEPTPVWKARRAAFDAAGLEEYRGIQPWALTERGITPTRSARVRMEMTFESDVDAPAAFLVVERAENFSIQLNGQDVPTDTSEWHWDKRFRKMPVGDLVRRGTNELVLATEYKLGVEIEDVFVIGDFATRKVDDTTYAITPEPASLEAGDWGGQGYHFYAGNMVYRKQVARSKRSGERTRLRLANPKGTLFEVRVNGQSAGTLAWQPWEADVTDLLVDGDNEIEIVVYGSLRNTFGPLHNTMYERFGNNWWIGPESFIDEENWADRYTLAPYGLIDGVELVRMKR